MIDATEKDIGRTVIYRPLPGLVEDGIITSIGVQFIFVRYRGDNHSKATRAEDLTWGFPDNGNS